MAHISLKGLKNQKSGMEKKEGRSRWKNSSQGAKDEKKVGANKECLPCIKTVAEEGKKKWLSIRSLRCQTILDRSTHGFVISIGHYIGWLFAGLVGRLVGLFWDLPVCFCITAPTQQQETNLTFLQAVIYV